MKRRTDEEISAPLYEYDAAIRARYGCFAGVDEAGRGSRRYGLLGMISLLSPGYLLSVERCRVRTPAPDH